MVTPSRTLAISLALIAPASLVLGLATDVGPSAGVSPSYLRSTSPLLV